MKPERSAAAPLPPVIVIGMHRSGTSMITRMLERLGLLVGRDLEDNHESKFFIGCNRWLIGQSKGSWTFPAATRWLAANDDLLELCADYLRERLSSPATHSYLGWGAYLRGARLVAGLPRPWGWKDPRNTLTLPVWLRVFAAARVVHIYRNGVPVAASLREVARRELDRSRAQHARRMRRGRYRRMLRSGRFSVSPRCLDLAGGFSLWEEYLETAFARLEPLGTRALTIRYEDCLADPAGTLARLADFCGLAAEPGRIEAIASHADTARGMRFMRDPELAAFYERVRGTDWMRRLGYG